MIKALRGYVIIEPIKDEEKTSAGVYLPETAKDKPMKGTVIDIGSGVWDGGKYYTPFITKGDVIFYKKWQNSEVKVKDKDYVFVQFGDLLGIELNESN